VTFSDQFSQVADAYAQRRPRYPDQLFAYLAQVASRHQLAWDCAAGTGQASVPLARYFHRVVATDASPTMLARAPRRPQVEYRTATAEASGLEAETVDLVTVAQALHWLDREGFYAEADRVLRPGGVLAAWTYGVQVLGDPTLNAVLSRFYRDTVGPYWPPERRHVEAGYRSLMFPYPELETPSFQMEEHWNLDELLGYVATWSATQHFREAKNRDPVPELAQALQPLWGEPGSILRVVWPLKLRLGLRPF
jgi:ubiquinone/menaquinone biosynthesis C-methylase UbiE